MRRVLFVILFCIAVSPTLAAAELFGPLRERDLTTFGISRLDMRPAHAVQSEPGTWLFEADLGYQNTWALSPKVQQYLESFDNHGRHRLGPDDLAVIEAFSGENYLADTELAALDITTQYQFSKVWSAYAIVSGLSAQGGFLDGLIEDFHSFFGFQTYGRDAVRRDDINNIFLLKSGKSVQVSAPSRMGLSDPTIGFRYTGIHMPQNWQLVLESAFKIPLRSRDDLLSTGRFDYGVQASLQYIGKKQGVYLSIAGVNYAGMGGPIPQDSQIIPTVIAAYERSLTSRTSIIAQGYASKSVFTKRETDLDELTAGKYLLSLGVRHHRQHFVYTFAVTENLQNMNNTPDISFQLGVMYLP